MDACQCPGKALICIFSLNEFMYEGKDEGKEEGKEEDTSLKLDNVSYQGQVFLSPQSRYPQLKVSLWLLHWQPSKQFSCGWPLKQRGRAR